MDVSCPKMNSGIDILQKVFDRIGLISLKRSISGIFHFGIIIDINKRGDFPPLIKQR